MVNFIYSPKNVNLSVSKGNGVIKAREYEELDEAHSIVRAAEEKAAEIVEEARTRYQSEKERGYREGRELADKDAFSRLVAEQVHLDRKLADLEKSLAGLVKTSVRSILAGFDDMALAESITLTALQKMRRESHLQIRLPHELIKDFEPVARKLKAAFPEVEAVELIEDGSLTPPNLVIESGTSRIECDLGRKFDELDALIDRTAAGLGRAVPATGPDREAGK